MIATNTNTHACAHTQIHAHKRVAGINEIAEPDASAAVYPALLVFISIMFVSTRAWDI